MKRKRKNACPSPPLLDDSPKRPKVQAQRKFAQGSNVNSPVITPIKELEDIPRIETLPEPVELLPMKRPNTEDFLTFLCFRGTPILPPSLNFFNTASIVDMNGQVHEIKSESSSKNGPIDIAKCGNSSEKPFIAFGVRKRADPIVISKQMDRKRRHALALQALRRKYQEQKMAKIRAIAISKHSEKVTNKTLVKTNTVSKTETVTKKNNTLQKTKIVATKHIKVTTQTLKTTLRPKINQKMCLRSFRGRFIHKELPFRKKIVADKKINRPILRKIEEDSNKNDNEDTSVDISDTEDNILKPSVSGVKSVRKVVTDPSSSVNSRMTRSGIINKDVSERLKQKRLLITNTKPLIKSRLLRSTTMKKTILSRRKSKKQLRTQQKKKILLESKSQTEINTKTEVTTPEKKIHPKNDPKQESSKSTEVKKDFKKVTDIKKESNTICDKNKKQINKSIDIKKEISKSTDIKKKIGKVEIKRNTRVSNIIEKRNLRKEMTNLRNVNTRLRTKDTVIDNKEKEDDVKDKKSETSKIKKSGAKLSEAEEPKLKSKQNEGIDNDFCKTRSSSNKESTKLSSHSNQSEIPKKSTEDIPKRKSNRSFSVNKDTNLAKEEVEREKRKLESTKKDLKKVVTNKEEAAKDKQDTDNADKIENSTINKDSENKESDDDKDKQKKKQCKETSQNKKVDEEKETDQNKKEKETDKNKKEKEADKNKKEKEADKNKKEKETDKNKKEKEAEKNKKEKETDQNKSETSFEKTEEEKIDSENLAKIDELKKQTSKDNPKKKKVCDNTKIKEDNSKNEGSDKQKLTKRSTNINSEEVQLKTDNMIEESNDKNKNEKMNDLSLKKQSDLQKDNVIENISDIKEEILFSENEHIQIDDLSKKEDQLKKDNEKNKATENNEDKLKNKVLPLKKIDVLPKKKDDLKKCSSKDVNDDKVDKLTLPSKKKDDSKRIENNQDQSEMINVLPSDCLKQEKINEKVDDELKSKVVDTDDDEYKQKNKNEPTLKVDALTKKDSSKKDYNDKSKNKNESTVTSKNVNNKKEEENLKKKLELSKKKDALPKKKAEINKIKIENEKIKEDNPKNKVDLDLSPKINPRPTRKTKEAAAIYMEILSHKLVDNQIDDDNISIDSFPELPNVKKTEQRENELKAQAKFTKDEIKGKSKDATESTIIEPKGLIKDDPGQNSNSNEEKVVEKAMTIVEKPLKIVEKPLKIVDKPMKIVEKPMKIVEKPMKIEIEIKNLVPKNLMEEQEKEGKRDIKEKVVIKKDDKKKKSNVTINTVATVTKEAETSNEILQTNTKRQTRSAHLNKTESSEDSDQSFHINIKVPRKKKLTRSKTLVKNPKNPEKPALAQKGVVISTKVDNIDVCSISDSDESTSDINLQALINKEKNKKFSKTKSKKSSNCFSDSDEEPLSKLTNKAVDSQSKSKFEHLKESRSSVKTKASSSTAVMKPNEIENERKEKPKRECAKRPQNYLPMFSSSDDEDTFHGFDEKVETRTTEPILNPVCSHASPLLDFFAKDISRRFGKEKVNMSNEQIEKWLTESALAGSSIKKENDEMLKFGEKIPTETTLEINESIDTVQLKTSLLQEEAIKTETRSKSVVTAESNKIQEIETKQNVKPQVIDRKLIFRKSKIQNTPNINAFSPENESSIYAFGEDNEDVISTPFRRPSRRPSSTATSRSEDEFSKNEESTKACQFRKPPLKQEIKTADCDSTTECEESHFYIPQNPSKVSYTKQHSSPNKKFDAKTFSKGKCPEKMYDTDDFKYKVPSSPSASSSSSTKLYKRQTYKSKVKTTESVSPIYMSDFPKKGDPAKLVEAPTFHPTDQEFQDPLEYIERIRHKAEQFGICRIVPPNTFKPECKVTDDMRFTAYNQYVHKMLHRWGPNFKELMAIKKYLETQNISITQPPWIGGMEIDLPRLYQTVQNLGGLKEVIEKKKWPRVSDLMKIPKSAQDRVTKLDDIYCKYLLPYDTLSPAEREKLFDDVETEWAKRESKSFLRAQEKSNIDTSVEGDSDPEDNDVEECITKGRNMALNGFYRIARNTMSMYFKTTEPPAVEVEQEYWNYVMTRQNHICVHSGSIDSGSWGYGFAISKNSPFARHPWNLKVLTNNNGSLLRSLGPAMGVTVPTLHVGMVFSACCWYRDPHGLPWIEYLHTGGSKIWYAIPNSMSDSFHSTMKTLVPNYCRNKELWLPSDTAMVPPNLLVENNVSLCRTVQDPGQFIVVFPKVFTSSLSTGYVVSESVYFAPTYWLKTARSLFDSLRNCSEPSMFCLDRLLLSIASDVRCNPEILRQVIPHIQELCDKEKTARDKLRSFGQMEVEKLAQPEINKNKKKLQHSVEGDYECDICRASLFISVVFDTQEGLTYCLNHAIEKFESQEIEISKCKLIITYDYDELTALPDKMKTTIEIKLQKKNTK